MLTQSVWQLGFISTFIVLTTFVKADKFTGLCPSGYPRLLNYDKTGLCYPIGKQGPCGKLMTFRYNPYKPTSGYCGCRDLGTTNCLGRPLMSWPSNGRCYFAYSQGPCKKGQWLTWNKYGQTQCRKNPCPIVGDERRLINAESSTSSFYFEQDNKCHQTGTRAFCKSGEKVYFVDSDPYPRCFKYTPWRCDGEQGAGGLDTSTSTFGNIKGSPLVGFGIPYDDI